VHSYEELNRAREDMPAQSELYRPSVCWDEASSRIAQKLETYGVDQFRSMPTSLGFFVPTYGVPSSGFSKEQTDRLLDWFRGKFARHKKPQLALGQFLSGHMPALADYRVLLAADDSRKVPHLHAFSESLVGEPVEHFEFNGRFSAGSTGTCP
jgi:putative sugar O-methyltransferase